MTDVGHTIEGGFHKSDTESLLRPLVTCGICLGLYVNPVALLDCLHLVCGSCAVEWLDQSQTCPLCRENVRGARDSHHTAAFVEAYKTIAPDSNLCHERTPEELALLNKKYRPGQLTTRSQGQSQRSESSESSDDDDTNDEFEEEAYLDSQTSRSIAELRNVGRPDYSCLFCDANNAMGYVCSQPCPPQAHNTIPAGHTTCGFCARFLPAREDRPSCVVCTRTTCHEIGQTCVTDSVPETFLIPLKDVEFPDNWTFPLAHAFGENAYERRIFRDYLAEQGESLQGLFRKVLAFRGPAGLPRATWHGPDLTRDAGVVSPDDKTCMHCAMDLLEASLFDWWLLERQTATLPEEASNREDCWYGIACRTARHNSAHASNWNHICHLTRGGDELQQYIPENGNRVVVLETSTLNHTFPAYSPSDVLFRDIGNKTMFMCSTVHQDDETGEESIIPGKLTMWQEWNVSVFYAMNGDECLNHGTVQILKDMRNMRWVRTSKGVVPAGCRPVVGGHTMIGGSREVLYHCAVWWRGQRVPGYTSPRTGRAVITWDGSEWYIEDGYELLCWNE
ncbi:hypothetical protein FRC12_009720 [Ceratobasidium sp. 428]|nr:hypothetical protein FRC12_009720 [Ceratobasidium sp. 428]